MSSLGERTKKDGPHLTYYGDLTGDLLHRVLGPDTCGGYVVVTDVSYDVLLHVTDAHVRPLGPAELELVETDVHGQAWLHMNAAQPLPKEYRP